MDYEKAYKEALERARQLRKDVNQTGMTTLLEEVFPELRESEDERIRKMCIGAVNIAASAEGGLLHSEASECLAWLEEQKDKNCLACDQHLKGYIAGRKATEEEKQKESLHIPESCKENADSFTSQCGDNRFEIIDKAKKDILEKTNIKSSPDEMKVLDNILFRAWQMGWLSKYDVIVPEQKPVEWSEEDKRILDDVSHLLIMLNYKDMARDYKKAVEKLIYRPHWKPSEEHLSALLAVFNDPNNIGSQTCQLALTDLYNDLKKLMED